MGHLYHGYVSHNQRVFVGDDLPMWSGFPNVLISPMGPCRCALKKSTIRKTTRLTGGDWNI